MYRARPSAVGIILVISSLLAWPAGTPALALGSQPASSSPSLPVAGHPAPAFALAGADGKRHALAGYRGRPVVLYFFCGCIWCQQCARAWGEIQRSGALSPPPSSPHSGQDTPITLIVYSGDAQSARDFARQQGLDMSQTVLLPDVEMEVTDQIYNAEPCPRVLVIDPHGVVRYVNDHKDDTPRVAPAMAIVSRVVDSVRSCQNPAGAGKR